MGRYRLLTLAACLAGLWLGDSAANAQYPYIGSRYYPRPPRARLSPYLNLIRGQDQNVDLAIDYYLGTIPERERRFNETLLNSRVDRVEQQEAALYREVRPEDEIIPPVPTAGRPRGSRTVADYFRQDPAVGAASLRRPPLLRR